MGSKMHPSSPRLRRPRPRLYSADASADATSAFDRLTNAHDPEDHPWEQPSLKREPFIGEMTLTREEYDALFL